MTTPAICIALLGLLLFGLGFGVSMTRGRTDVVIGHPDDPADFLHKMVRAHGNTAEYAPMLAVLIFWVGSGEPSTWAIVAMWVAVASRYAIVAGLLLSPTLAKPHPLRFLGALGTYLAGFALVAAVFRSL